MKIIGLTGGIGSGKSTVARILGELGAEVIDADKLGHEVFKPGTPAWQDVVAAFGSEVVSPSGEIDRKKLGEIVFRDGEALERLNRIMHPRIYEVVKKKLDVFRKRGAAAAVVEATLLVEAGWTPLMDEVWVTVSSKHNVVSRVKERGLSESEIMARIMSQTPAEERVKHADVVIRNEGSLEDLRNRVEQLWRERVQTDKPSKSV